MTDEDLKDEWETPIPWLFEPVWDVREDSIYEVVFIKKWQKLMGGARVEADHYYIYNEPQDYPLLAIHDRFFRHSIPDERDARVYSSFISWLGTKAGQGYLNQAERLKSAFGRAASESIGRFTDFSDAYVAAWAVENIRTSVCDDYTPREYISKGLIKVFGSAVTLHDIQIMDSAAHWLGRPDGQIFLEKCQSNINLKLERERQAFRDVTRARILERRHS